MRVVPGKRDATSASEIEELPSDLVEDNSVDSRVESVVPNSDFDANSEVNKQGQTVSTENSLKSEINNTEMKQEAKTRTISTGTSPPPQNMSTQVNPSYCLESF